MIERVSSSHNAPKENANNADITGLLNIARKKGSPDLADIQIVDRGRIVRWYKDTYEQLTPTDRVDFLEEFMRHDLMDDQTAVAYVMSMDKEQKKRVGEYIGRTMHPGIYVQCFYECWPHLDYDTARQFAELFAVKHPQDAIMVAPFQNLVNMSVKEERTDLEIAPVVPLLRFAYRSVQDARRMLDAVVEYFERHTEIHGRTLEGRERPTRLSRFEERQRRPRNRNRFSSANAQHIDNIIQDYWMNNFAVLSPYLKRLSDLDLLTPDQIQEFFQTDRLFLQDITKKDEAEINRLAAKLKGADKGHLNTYPSYDAVPQRYVFEIEKIRDAASMRLADVLLDSFQEHRAMFAFDVMDYLVRLIVQGTPVFAKINSLGLDKEEVRRLLMRSQEYTGSIPFLLNEFGDMKKLIEWNRTHAGEPDLEKILTEQIAHMIDEESEYCSIAPQFKIFLDWFAPNNRDKIIATINRRAPSLWLQNLTYATDHRVLPFDTLLAQSAQCDSKAYLNNLNAILYHLRLSHKEGSVLSIGLNDIRQTVRTIITGQPYYLLAAEFKRCVEYAFTEEERISFIEAQLNATPLDSLFFKELIDRIEEFDAYTHACRRILVSNPELFIALTRHGIPAHLDKILSIRDITHLLIHNKASLDFADLIDEKLTLDLLQAPQHLERLQQVLADPDTIGGLMALAKRLDTLAKAELIKGGGAYVSRLNEEMRSSAIRSRDDAVEALRILCESNRFAVFQEGLLTLLGADGESIARDEITDYAAIHPNILLRGTYRDNTLAFQKVLGEEAFSRLFRTHIHALAFWSDRYGGHINIKRLPQELAQEVMSKNPLLEIASQERLSDDLHRTIVQTLAQHRFYPLYADRMEAKAREELTLRGPQRAVEWYRLDPDFTAWMRTVAILENSDFARNNEKAIYALPPAQQKELIEMLIFVTLQDLEAGLDVPDLTTDSYADITRIIRARILDFSKKVFDMESAEVSPSDPLSLPVMRALSIYYDKSCRDHPQMKKAFRQAVAPILAGRYQTWRAWDSMEEPRDDIERQQSLERLKNERLLPSNLSLAQYTQWLTDERTDFSETFSYHLSDIRAGVQDILSLAVADGHVSEDILHIDDGVLQVRSDALMQPIRELSARQQGLKKEMQNEGELTEEQKEEYEDIKTAILDYRNEHGLEIARIEAMRYLEHLRHIRMDELEAKRLSVGRKPIAFKDVFNTLTTAFSEQPDFLSDVRRIQQLFEDAHAQIFQGGRISKQQLVLTDQVDLETSIRIGERPVPSCQNYDSSSNFNRGLLSYLSDPAVRIGQIWDEDGQIIARAIFRLMEDKDQASHLFMERVYSVNNHPKIKEAMARLGAAKAASMGIGFHTQERENIDNEAPVTLYSRGSRCPYVYTDAGGGLTPRGVFNVVS